MVFLCTAPSKWSDWDNLAGKPSDWQQHFINNSFILTRLSEAQTSWKTFSAKTNLLWHLTAFPTRGSTLWTRLYIISLSPYIITFLRTPFPQLLHLSISISLSIFTPGFSLCDRPPTYISYPVGFWWRNTIMFPDIWNDLSESWWHQWGVIWLHFPLMWRSFAVWESQQAAAAFRRWPCLLASRQQLLLRGGDFAVTRLVTFSKAVQGFKSLTLSLYRLFLPFICLHRCWFTKEAVPVPKLSSPQREQRPESIRFPKYLQPVGVSYSASFMALATLQKHIKKQT